MRHRTQTLLTLMMSGTVVALGLPTAAHGQQSESTAFAGVNVISMLDDQVTTGQTVVVEADRIVAIGPSAEISLPQDVTVVDGAGRYLIPGLTDFHSHIDSEERVLQLLVANGQTTAQALNASPTEVIWSGEIAAGDRFGPTLITGPAAAGLPQAFLFVADLIERATAPYLDLQSLVSSFDEFGVPLDADSGREFVETIHTAGADFVKTNLFLSREAFDAIVATAGELGMPIEGHVWGDIGLEHYLESGADPHHFSEVAAYLSADAPQGVPFMQWDFLEAENRMAGLVDMLATNGTWFTPTVNLGWYLDQHYAEPEALFERPQVDYVSPAEAAGWKDPTTNFVYQFLGDDPSTLDFTQRYLDVQRRFVEALHDAGVPILAGTDASAAPGSVQGFDLHLELQMLVDYGLSPYEALSGATRLPAEYFGERGEWGTVEVGARADLVLLGSNPLEDIRSTQDIDGVMLRGQWLPRSALDAMLDGIVERFAALADVQLGPYTSDPPGLSGAAPIGWASLGEGVWTRSDPDTDPTFLVQRHVSAADGDDMISEILSEFGATELGDPVERISSESLDWNVYLPEAELGLAVAVAETPDSVVVVALAALQDEFETLAELVLRPVVAEMRASG